MTVIIEYLEIKKRNLLLNFKFERENVFIGKSVQHFCTLDKYMTVDNWKDVYHKLNRPIDIYSKCADKPLSPEKISLGRAQLDLHISWHKTKTFYTAMFGETNDKNWFQYYMTIEVKLASKLSEYKRLRDGDTEISSDLHKNGHKSEKLNSSNDSTESKQSETAKEVQKLLNNEVEEYVPTASSSLADPMAAVSYPKYTPTPVKNSTVFAPISEIVDDEYTPPGLCSNDDIATSYGKNVYHPRPIHQRVHKASNDTDALITLDQTKTNSDTDMGKKEKKRNLSATVKKKSVFEEMDAHEHRKLTKNSEVDANGKTENVRPKKIRTAHRELTENRQNLSQDLFGESDPDDNSTSNLPLYDNVTLSARRLKLSRRAKEDQHYIEPTEDSAKHKSKSDKNLSESKCDSNVTKRFKSSDDRTLKGWLSKEKFKEKTRHDKDQKPGKSRKPHKEEDVTTKITNEEMAEYNENHAKKMNQLKRIQAQLAEADKPLTPERIINLKDLSPEEVESSFDCFADKLSKIFTDYVKQSSYRPKKARDYDHISIQTNLLNPPLVHKMVDKLRKEFANIEIHGATAFNELFWELMVPEWALALFMDRFSMTREQAVEQVRLQENISVEQSSSFELI